MNKLLRQVKEHRQVIAVLLAILIPTTIIASALLRIHRSDPVETITTDWARSGHADFLSRAFNHWNDDEPPLIPANCAACHSLHGLLDYVGERGTPAGTVSQDMPIGTVVSCLACHNDSVHSMRQVSFPSSAVVHARGKEASCLICHQGRESTISVNEAISGLEMDTVYDDLAFISVHYHVAAATLMGTTAQGGYEYDGRDYAGRFEHTLSFQSCNSCHDPHHLRVDPLPCSACHVNVTGYETLRQIRHDETDYDGDGNVRKGIAAEIETFHALLYEAIQAYAQEVTGVPIVYNVEQFPYFFTGRQDGEMPDPDALSFANRYVNWTPRLIAAAYNYHFIHMDPGAYAHNPRYALQLLYDSLQDMNERVNFDLSRLQRPD
ncbi:MAG: polyheme membrane-associated cytochrome C [Aggregatilineales bacterium]